MLFTPTFESNISAFEITEVDEENNLVKTKAYPQDKESQPFEDSIELNTLQSAFEIGEYKLLGKVTDKPTSATQMHPYYPLHNYLSDLDNTNGYRHRNVIHEGEMCARCKNRFGGCAKQEEYCTKHRLDKNCMRFKLDK